MSIGGGVGGTKQEGTAARAPVDDVLATDEAQRLLESGLRDGRLDADEDDLLAFLGAGHTHQSGDHPETVRRGLDYLRRMQATNGSLAGRAKWSVAERSVTGGRRLKSA